MDLIAWIRKVYICSSDLGYAERPLTSRSQKREMNKSTEMREKERISSNHVGCGLVGSGLDNFVCPRV